MDTYGGSKYGEVGGMSSMGGQGVSELFIQQISLFYGADESTTRMMQAHVEDAIDDPASEAPHIEPCLDHSVCVGGVVPACLLS